MAIVKPTIALLSQAFVAFTIEADTELEQRMPHRTGEDRGNPAVHGPLITSLTYWQNYFRHIPDEGTTARELALVSGDDRRTMKSRLDELRRWGYVKLEPVTSDPLGTNLVSTPNLRAAREHWAPIESRIEGRWRGRFGPAVDELASLLGDTPDTLPVGFPLLGWDSSATVRLIEPTAPTGLGSLLARAIITEARAFDEYSPTTLAITLNFLRVIPAHGALVRDLPLLAGVSKESLAILIGRMHKAGQIEVTSDTPSGKHVRLSLAGEQLRDDVAHRVEAAESAGALRSRADALRFALEAIVTDRLAEGLHQHPDSWRLRPRYRRHTDALLADAPGALPWFPLVSHRAGWPDGH